MAKEEKSVREFEKAVYRFAENDKIPSIIR